MTVLCSIFTAGELRGYGFKGKIRICDETAAFVTDRHHFAFIRYPSDVHLKDGLLVADTDAGFIYSADLFTHRIIGNVRTISSSWKKEVDSIGAPDIPDSSKLDNLKKHLLDISPKFIATGHGSCINLD